MLTFSRVMLSCVLRFLSRNQRKQPILIPLNHQCFTRHLITFVKSDSVSISSKSGTVKTKCRVFPSVFLERDRPFSTYAKLSEKLTFLNP